MFRSVDKRRLTANMDWIVSSASVAWLAPRRGVPEPAEQRLPILVELFQRLDGLAQRLLDEPPLGHIDGDHDGPHRVSGGIAKGRETERKRPFGLDQLCLSIDPRERTADALDHPRVVPQEIGRRPAQRT